MGNIVKEYNKLLTCDDAKAEIEKQLLKTINEHCIDITITFEYFSGNVRVLGSDVYGRSTYMDLEDVVNTIKEEGKFTELNWFHLNR